MGCESEPVILCELLQQMDSLMHVSVPSLSLLVFEGSITESLPFLEQHCATILFAEISSQGILKAATESHSRARLLFAPTVEVAVTITARAAEILADLRVAIHHRNRSACPLHRCHRLTRKRA